MTLTTNHETAGNLCVAWRGVKCAPSFDGQIYDPRAYLWDTELQEWVSFYWSDHRVSHDGAGAQSIWLENGASVDNEDEFGIKLTSRRVQEGSNAKAAAFAMYQRQKAAAEHGAAPPVHGMCCFKVYDKVRSEVITYWGYLSCVAEVNEDLEYSQEALDAWDNLCSEYESKREHLDAIESALDDLGFTGRCAANFIRQITDDCGLVDPDDMDRDEWMRERADDGDFELYDGMSDLKETLSDICLDGYQSDWKPIGTTLDGYYSMGGDLHACNVGYWQGNLVAIDFGYHCMND